MQQATVQLDIRDLLAGLHKLFLGPTPLTDNIDRDRDTPQMDYLYDLVAALLQKQKASRKLDAVIANMKNGK